MKIINLVAVAFLLASCSPDASNTEASSTVVKIAPYEIHLGIKKSEIDALYPPELREKNKITDKMMTGLNKKYGVVYFGESINNNITSMHMHGNEITDNLLGEKHVYNTRFPDTFELVTDTNSNQSYVSKMSIQRQYLVKGKCQDNLASFRKEMINQFGSPIRVLYDKKNEYKAYYEEKTEKRNNDGQKIKEGTELYARISCSKAYNEIFLQVFGTNYNLLSKYPPL